MVRLGLDSPYAISKCRIVWIVLNAVRVDLAGTRRPDSSGKGVVPHIYSASDRNRGRCIRACCQGARVVLFDLQINQNTGYINQPGFIKSGQIDNPAGCPINVLKNTQLAGFLVFGPDNSF